MTLSALSHTSSAVGRPEHARSPEHHDVKHRNNYTDVGIVKADDDPIGPDDDRTARSSTKCADGRSRAEAVHLQVTVVDNWMWIPHAKETLEERGLLQERRKFGIGAPEASTNPHFSDLSREA